MDCTPTCHEVPALAPSLPDDVLQAERAQQIKDRQAAAGYLEAARQTADEVVRERLRRRGAELLSRSQGNQ